eukprot:XP_011675535.1 PREDICTED: C-type lectin domain family 17, member A-like [Strongylocentrotus purpuratus]
MVGYNCNCSSGFQGRHCDEQSTESSTMDATTKPTSTPTTTMSDTMTSQATTIIESTESSTTVATTKPTTRPTTTLSDTATSQEITTSTYLTSTVEYVGSFYNFSTSEMSHDSAVSACSQYGSHLVFIESQEEQDFIERSAGEDYWIGLTASSPGEARWLDGSTVTYTKFNSLSFDDHATCFRIREEHGYTWEDKPCYARLRFICEK